MRVGTFCTIIRYRFPLVFVTRDDTAKSFGTESTGDSWDALFSGLKRDA